MKILHSISNCHDVSEAGSNYRDYTREKIENVEICPVVTTRYPPATCSANFIVWAALLDNQFLSSTIAIETMYIVTVNMSFGLGRQCIALYCSSLLYCCCGITITNVDNIQVLKNAQAEMEMGYP